MISWLDSLRADTVFGWRQIKKSKITSAAAILSLALAIGACTSAFRLIDALLFRPLPVANPERLYAITFEGFGMDGKTSVYDSCSYPMFLRARETVKPQAELIAISYADRTDLTYTSDQQIEKAYLQYVSGWMFDSFGLRPALGRLFTADDDQEPGAHPYVVLSYDYWTRRFGRDPNILNKPLRIAQTYFQIIGVAEERFTGTETGIATELFLPMAMKNPRTLASNDNFWLRTLVQLKPGVAPAPVQERLRVTYRAIQEERAKGFVAMSKQRLELFFKERLSLEPAAAGRSNMQRDYQRSLAALGSLVLLVLLIACANLANLMAARASARAREMALRISIGAARFRLVQLVVVESAWLAVLACFIGAIFAWWSAPIVVRMINPPDTPARLFLPFDWRVVSFALLLTLIVTCLCGLIPALRVSAIQPVNALKGGDDPRSRRRLMYGLIALQVSFCFVVQFVAGLFTATFEHLANLPTGFSADRIVNLETLTQTPQSPILWDQVASRLRTLPGVEKVALIGWPLLSGESAVGYVSINGAPPTDVFSDFLYISPGWAEVMKIPFLAGRDFRPDDANPKVALVNQAFARQYFGGANPVGKAFERVDSAGARTRTQIVGLIADARSRDLRMRQPIRPTAYVPFRALANPLADQETLRPSGRGTYVVRTIATDPLSIASMLRREVPQARAGFYVSNIRTQIALNRQQTVRERLLAVLALFFAAVALLLAGVGLFGVLDYSVLQRRREIGIRMAIGARSFQIARSVTVDVFIAVLVGAILGVGLGLASTRYLAALFYGVTASDPQMLALPGLTVLAAAVLAALPAVVRALRIDPVALLRSE